MNRTTCSALLAVCFSIGCGSRSGLGEAVPDEPPDVAPTSPCAALVAHGPVITPADAPSPALDDALRITPLANDGQLIELVFVRKGADGVLSLKHASLMPWAVWPESGGLEPVFGSGIQTLSSHAIGRSTGGDWAALVRTGMGLYLTRGLAPGAGGSTEADIEVPGIDPMFVALDESGEERHLAGSFDLAASSQRLRATFVGPNSSPVTLPDLGCATGQPPRAAAVGFGDHWLVAASRSANKGCIGSPTVLAVLSVREKGSPISVATLPSETPIVDVQIARHPTGAFVAYSTAGPDGGRIVAARIDGGGVVAGPTPISPPNLAITSFALGSVGDQLAVAWRKDFDLVASVFDSSLGLRAETVVASEPSFGPSALHGSPKGQGLVVAWTATPPGDFRVRVARLDCAQ